MKQAQTDPILGGPTARFVWAAWSILMLGFALFGSRATLFLMATGWTVFVFWITRSRPPGLTVAIALSYLLSAILAGMVVEMLAALIPEPADTLEKVALASGVYLILSAAMITVSVCHDMWWAMGGGDARKIVERLKAKRRELELSNADFARRLGIPRLQWRAMQSGVWTSPDMFLLRRVARAFPEMDGDVLGYLRGEDVVPKLRGEAEE
jgi:hypothetical protein